MPRLSRRKQNENSSNIGVCPNCGKEILSDYEYCPYCNTKLSGFITSNLQGQIMVTTGNLFDGYKVIEYMTILTSEVVIGTGSGSQVRADFAHTFGGRMTKFEGIYSQAESIALANLNKKAANIGANALLGIDIKLSTITSTSSYRQMIVVVATGTAVKIEKD